MRHWRKWIGLGLVLFVGLFVVLSLGYVGIWNAVQGLVTPNAETPISSLWTQPSHYLGAFLFATILSLIMVITSIWRLIPSRETREAELAVRAAIMEKYGIESQDSE
ncbi:hypothetical protein [Sulfobacillus harzensis]|uniref:Uncharacterized protein n=1 Tax=Sulfobacillus harzensis TaxID=2729629 RepID=A0A7Y0LAV0_9FIRM|nr:hypothetical protein [Sulfobacillus harzensis]NMP25044.1 hypothetical protein [Sulfobacillus harzensis]